MAHGQDPRPIESSDGTAATVKTNPDGSGQTLISVSVDRPVTVGGRAAFLQQIGVSRKRAKLFGRSRVF